MPHRLVPPLPAHARETLVRFLRAQVEGSGASGVVVGLSGGVDSATAATLAVEALGRERVQAFYLPDAPGTDGVAGEVRHFAEGIGLSLAELDLGPWIDRLSSDLPELSDRRVLGNVKARLRMVALYAKANARGSLVLGTGNKSELLLGYFTKYGDGGADLLPLGDLYKTPLYTLARELGVPEPILARPPTAGLYAGQTDEEELGAPYALLDAILYGLERVWEPSEIAKELSVPLERVLPVVDRVERNRHKRRLPPIPKLGLRTVGLDWRD